ncbi:type V CRISPR-associated protein Cas12b [Prosthecobacter sp.]
MNTVYRTYEVLVEETLSANDPKRQKTSKPSRENAKTRRALETTHRLFQDAVCYYMLCLIGLVRDAKEARQKDSNSDINPLWRTLTTGEMGKKTNQLVRRLSERYQASPWHGASGLEEFLKRIFCWKQEGVTIDRAHLVKAYKILFGQATAGKDGEELADSLENLKSFAGTWIAILSNENGATTLPGGGVYDVLHRTLKQCITDDARLLEDKLLKAIQEALSDRESDLAMWREARLNKALAENDKAKKKKGPGQINAAVDKAVAEKVSKEALTVRDAYLKALSSEKTAKYCSLSPEQISNAINLVKGASASVAVFPRLRFGARDNAFEQPLFRYILLKDVKGCREAVTQDVWEYVRKTDPEVELMDDQGKALAQMPYQSQGNEPLFPYFTNCLGISVNERAAWFDFDKSAFKRAAEEVFKYRIRSDKRQTEYDQKAQKVLAMEAKGEWEDARGAVKELAGIFGDSRAPLMKRLLDELGGSIGYGLRRGTIGGWGDLREDFLKASKDGEPDGEKLEQLVNKAQADSGGGFGSAVLFKKLCEPDFFPLWQERCDGQQAWHPKNFLSWYVRYAEALEELTLLTDKPEPVEGSETAEPSSQASLRLKPISITLPGTDNRHGETSFRPLDFDCKIEPHPHLDLFDEPEPGKYCLVRTNAAWVKEKLKDGGPEGAEYPLTLSYRRLKRDRITDGKGLSIDAFYQPPLVVEDAPDFHREEKEKAVKANKPAPKTAMEISSSLLPPAKPGGAFHFTMAMPVEIDGLMAGTPKIDDKKHADPAKRSEDSVRYGPPLNGEYTRLYFRWPIDADTEKKSKEAATDETGEATEAAKKGKLSPAKFWCAKEFEPFHLLSVDLGVRFAGAWCRAKVFKGEPKDGQRVISSPTDEAKTGKIVFGVEHASTFRLQGEDVKLWRKRKGQPGHSFEQEPCGSKGRLATVVELEAFAKLAEEILPASVRTPLSDLAERKYFPQLAGHLQFRLARRLGQLRMLSNLRWRVAGRVKKEGHVYRELAGDELAAFQREQRLRVIDMLDFKPRDNDPEDQEEGYMQKLRLALADDTAWNGLTFTPKGEAVRLFGKQRTKAGKDAQKKAQDELKAGLLDSSVRWNWTALEQEVTRLIDEAMKSFQGENSLVARAAHFVWPLIKKRWQWRPCQPGTDGQQSLLECVADEQAAEQNITGMRGLNMRRIELLQEFRRCCQSLAKIERRYYRDPNKGLEPSPVRESDRIYEPAPAWIDKINEMRDQRVHQTAHLILAEALGLELMNPDEVLIDGMDKAALKSERDVHGRYKKNPAKPRVAAIVLEDLSRYRTSQDRSRFENRQLMEWSHRKVLEKLQDMAKVFGIPIFTVDARFSSRFNSRTGVPGVRCIEVSKGFELEHPWKHWKEETVASVSGKNGERVPSERAGMINAAAALLADADAKASVILPMDGGPAFFPVVPHRAGHEGLESNADINAAVNIGLRAVAHPDRLDVFPMLKAIPRAGGAMEIQARRGSFAATVQKIEPEIAPEVKVGASYPEGSIEGDDEDAESGKIQYMFACPKVHGAPAFTIHDEERYPLAPETSGAVTKVYWRRVKQVCLERMANVNAARIAAWKKKAAKPDPSDEIPMG